MKAADAGATNGPPEEQITAACGNCAAWNVYRFPGPDGKPFASPMGECQRFPRTERKFSGEYCREHVHKKPEDKLIDAPPREPTETDDAYRLRLLATVGSHTVHQATLQNGHGVELDNVGDMYGLKRK